MRDAKKAVLHRAGGGASWLLLVPTVLALSSVLPLSGRAQEPTSESFRPTSITGSPSIARSDWIPAAGVLESTPESVLEPFPGLSPPRIPLRVRPDGSGRVPHLQIGEPGNSRPDPATSFLSSLVLPGSSQWMHGQDRTYLYLGLELAGWLGFLHGRHQGADYRDAYRDLAWTYARVDGGGEGFSGDFGFYETLGQWTSSGAWDTNPSTEGLQPETDPDTYNGSIWRLAADLYLSGEGADADPEAMRMAILYYQERAYPPEQAWDWSGNSWQRDRYRHLIERSDDSFRRATVILGAVVANHLLSAVDGFLSTRISDEHAVRLSSDARPSGRSRGMRWTFEIRLNPSFRNPTP